MSRPSLIASALLVNTSTGSLAAVAAGAQSLAAARSYRPQIAEYICDLTSQHLENSHGDRHGSAPCVSSSSTAETGPAAVEHTYSAQWSSSDVGEQLGILGSRSETAGAVATSWRTPSARAADNPSTSTGSAGARRLLNHFPHHLKLTHDSSTCSSSSSGSGSVISSGSTAAAVTSTSSGTHGSGGAGDRGGCSDGAASSYSYSAWNFSVSSGGRSSSSNTGGGGGAAGAALLPGGWTTWGRMWRRAHRLGRHPALPASLTAVTSQPWGPSSASAAPPGSPLTAAAVAFSSQVAVRASEAAAAAAAAAAATATAALRAATAASPLAAATAAAAAPSGQRSFAPSVQPTGRGRRRSAEKETPSTPAPTPAPTPAMSRTRGRPRKALLPGTAPIPSASAATTLGCPPASPPVPPPPPGALGTAAASVTPASPPVLPASPPSSVAPPPAKRTRRSGDAAAASASATAAVPADSGPPAATATAGAAAAGYVEFRDAGECYCGSSAHVGAVEVWHQQHCEDIVRVPARGPDVTLPSLELFERQIDMETQARYLALEEYRRELQDFEARGALDESKGARRLMDSWMPALTGQIEEGIQKFLSLEGSWRGANEAANKRRGTKAESARARTVGNPNPGMAMKIVEQGGRQPTGTGPAAEGALAAGATANTAADATAAPPSSSTSPTSSSSSSTGPTSEAGGHMMVELKEWVPHVLPVPPQVLARTVLASLINHMLVRKHEDALDLPAGMAKSTDTAEHIGERMVHIVSYMKVCEAIARKRQELQAAGRQLRDAKSAAAVAAQLQAERESGEAAATAAGPAGPAAAAAAGEAAPGVPVPGGGDLGPSGDDWESHIMEAALRVRAARKALESLKAAAAAVQPRSTARELAGVSAVRAAAGGGGGGAGESQCRKASRTRQLRQLAVSVPGLSEGMEEWTLERRIKVGASLLALAIKTLRVRLPAEESGGGGSGGRVGGLRDEPAFTHTTNALMTFQRGGYQTPGILMCHPQVLRMLEGDQELRRLLAPRLMPMVVEPRPWRHLRVGGLLTTTVPIVKTRDSPLLMNRLLQAHQQGRMQTLYDALTVLGNVPWQVNARVFGVMDRVINSGGGKLGLPPVQPRELPPRFTTGLNDAVRSYLGVDTPEQCGTPYMRLQREGRRGGQLLVGAGALSSEEEADYQRQCYEVRVANRNELGQRTMMKYRLEIARQLVGAYDTGGAGGSSSGGATTAAAAREEALASLMLPSFGELRTDPTVFYQPHNVDFRGRAYTLHPFLNHLGDDNTRALLQFGVGRPLGDRGFQWLLIQLANHWGRGVDKYPLPQRLAWGEARLAQVRASAAHPLDGGSGAWWWGAERPWQLLATCFEVAAALDSGGSSPASYISHLPVNQDGTCNGLQHYAALARDSGCGAAVNLLPADRPQDVYQAVANVVAERVERDRKLGRSEATKAYGTVDRKLVKQTVMTYVYGVTIIGAREQIENRLEERGWTNVRERRKVATYLARITFESMGKVFGPVVGVRSWLDAVAKFAVSTGRPVAWTSPLGFPIEQPYRKLPTFQMWTPLQKITLRDYRQEGSSPIDTRRQRSGFPPNYIHSLDGAHMMMTALAVREAGGVFAAVHDSFWTHAASVDDMNRIIRDKFIELHSRPLLGELRTEVAANPMYQSARSPLPPLPAPGDLQLDSIHDSTYFFS